MTVIKNVKPIDKFFNIWYEAVQNVSVEAAKIIDNIKEENITFSKSEYI